MLIDVEPKEYTQIVRGIQIKLNYELESDTCSFYCTLVNANKKIIDTIHLKITPEEYNKWTTNDEYIINLVLQKLDFVRTTN